jgi:alpha-1,6-mannosyltransferase
MVKNKILAMVNKKIISFPIYSWILVVCFFMYTILSWILLFRDQRALNAYSYFYPQLLPILFSIRDFLLRHGLNTLPTFIFAFVSLVAFFYYFRSFFEKISTKKTIIFAIIFQIIIFLSYPILSTDIFSYIMTSRVATVHHENIWKISPNHFPNDPFLKLSDWQNVTGIYGGINQVFYNGGSQIAGNNIFLNLLFYKIIPLLFVFLTMIVVYKIAINFYPANSSAIFRFIFWNPLFILEITGSAHNDALMLFFMLSAFYFLLKKHYVYSGIVFAFSMQIKIIPIVLLFFIFGSLVSKKRIRQSFSLLTSILATNAIIFYFMQIDSITYIVRALKNNDVYWQSLPTIFSRLHIPSNHLFMIFFIIILLAIFAYQIRKNTDPVESYITAMLFYLFFITSAYWNWYVLWIFVFLPFIKSKRLIRTGLIFSLTSLLAYPLYWLSLRYDYQNIAWIFVIYFLVFLVPAIFYYLQKPKVPIF